MGQMFTHQQAFPLAAVTHPTGRITARTQVRHTVTELTPVWKWPEETLDRTRLLALGISGLAMFTEFAQLGNALRSPGYTRLAAACIVAIFLILVFTYRRGQASWWTALPVPVLIAVGGAGLNDPVAGTALAMATTTVLSLYGSTPLWVARVLGGLIAIPAGLAISPMSGDRVMEWHSPTVFGVLPQLLLMSGLTRALYLATGRQARTAVRESLLARAGRDMLGVTDIAQVREVGRRAAEEIVKLSPGSALLVLRRRTEGLVVANLAGAPAELRGRVVDEKVLADPARLAALMPGLRAWRIDSLGVNAATAEVLIAIGGPKQVPEDALDAFRNLSHQVVLAENSCHAHDELEHRAYHDHLTQLPTRGKFLRVVGDAVSGTEAGRAALLNIDLDDFKRVNDEYGHAAGDQLLIQVADRISAAAEGRGLAARFGGDEFALVLTDLSEPAEAHRIAEALCAHLTSPITLTVGVTTVGASIGVAPAEPGMTVAELCHRADIAMYSAKAGGKNRIETYPANRRDADMAISFE